MRNSQTILFSLSSLHHVCNIPHGFKPDHFNHFHIQIHYNNISSCGHRVYEGRRQLPKRVVHIKGTSQTQGLCNVLSQWLKLNNVTGRKWWTEHWYFYVGKCHLFIIQKEPLYVYERLNATMFTHTCDSTGGVCMFLYVGYQWVISVSLLVMGVPTFSVWLPHGWLSPLLLLCVSLLQTDIFKQSCD